MRAVVLYASKRKEQKERGTALNLGRVNELEDRGVLGGEDPR